MSPFIELAFVEYNESAASAQSESEKQQKPHYKHGNSTNSWPNKTFTRLSLIKNVINFIILLYYIITCVARRHITADFMWLLFAAGLLAVRERGREGHTQTTKQTNKCQNESKKLTLDSVYIVFFVAPHFFFAVQH